jgi:hypothetical protein
MENWVRLVDIGKPRGKLHGVDRETVHLTTAPVKIIDYVSQVGWHRQTTRQIAWCRLGNCALDYGTCQNHRLRKSGWLTSANHEANCVVSTGKLGIWLQHLTKSSITWARGKFVCLDGKLSQVGWHRQTTRQIARHRLVNYVLDCSIWQCGWLEGWPVKLIWPQHLTKLSITIALDSGH